MEDPILDMRCFLNTAPDTARNLYFKNFALEADDLLRFLRGDYLPDHHHEFVSWYLESDRFFEDLQNFAMELRLRKTLLIALRWFPKTFLLSLTWRINDGWRMSLIPWPVVQEIREPLWEIFQDGEVLKLIVTESALKILEAEISEMKASGLLRQLLDINTYDYQQCSVSVESPHPDDVILLRVADCYLGKEKNYGISEIMKHIVIPMTSQDIDSQDTAALFVWSGLPVIVFAHTVLTVHAYLQALP